MEGRFVRIAVVGAGPVGLALALHAAQALPRSQITLFDARPAGHDISADPRTLALSLGSVHLLKRLVVWPASAEPILEVHVSQQPPGEAVVHLRAADEGVPMLGAVLAYGRIVDPLQRAWEAAVAAEPERLRSRFGTPVADLKPTADGVEVDAGIVEVFDLVVVAEGGVFGDQAAKALTHDYRQTAWVGSVTIEGGSPGTAFERFTAHGPVALLPLGGTRWAIVWCVAGDDDPVRELDDTQRLAVLAQCLSPEAGHLIAITPLKDFPLGLNAERTLVQRRAAGSGPGRVVRIGNAAQTLHPVAGQGLNLGLRDAYEIVSALRADADVDRALARVDWARAPDRWATIATTDFLARSFTWKAPGLSRARALGLAALEGLPPVKRWLARRMMFGVR